ARRSAWRIRAVFDQRPKIVTRPSPANVRASNRELGYDQTTEEFMARKQGKPRHPDTDMYPSTETPLASTEKSMAHQSCVRSATQDRDASKPGERPRI